MGAEQDLMRNAASEQALLEVIERALRDLQGEATVARRVTLDSALDRDLGLDSLSRMEVLLRIESAFGVSLPEDTLESAGTVRDLIAAVRRASPERARGAPAPVSLQAARDSALAATPDEAATLLDVLDWHVRTHGEQTQIVCLIEDEPHAITYGELAAGAARVAAGLQEAGLQPGQCVAIMLPTSPEYFETYLGIVRAGGIPVPIYPPTRASQVEDHVARHTRILANAQAAFLVTVPEALAVARLLHARVPGLRHVVTPQQLVHRGGRAAAVTVRGDDIGLLQYTSGSTGNPKGVMLTHANLLANIRAMVQVLRAGPQDVFVSWLPLYHDMGLIGAFLGTLYVGCTLVVMPPLAFLARPERWLWAIHRYRGTLSGGPNFAYELCLKRVDEAALEGLDLGSWRVAFNGAEAVSPDTVERFGQRFARFGLRPEALMPVYGLAECSVGLLFPPLGRGLRVDRIQRVPFSGSGAAIPAAVDDANALRFVAAGRPLAGHAVRIVDEQGHEVRERVEGRLEFRGPSATQGYFRNAEQTRLLFRDGWLDSGDRAYAAEGEIFPTGRVKDIVIRGGRHYYPEEIEAAVGAVEGVRKGCVAVFGSPDPQSGTERLIVLAEATSADPDRRARLREAVSRAVLDAVGEAADEIVLAQPHTVLKTSSGKLRRADCRAMYERGLVGAPVLTARMQLVRLALGAVVPRLRYALGRAGAALYSLYAVVLFCLIAPVVWLLAILTRTPAAAWSIARAGSRLFLGAAGLAPSVRGLERLPREGPCILVCNHASYLDGLLLVAALPRPYAFVAKRELGEQFFAGRLLSRLGARFVERVDVKRSVEDANRIAESVGGGLSLIVFPEGTFVARPGLLPFLLGAFLAAARARVPVVPVAIRGSRSVLPDGTWWPRRGRIQIEIEEALTPSQDESEIFAAAVRLRQEARARVARHLGAEEAPS